LARERFRRALRDMGLLLSGSPQGGAAPTGVAAAAGAGGGGALAEVEAAVAGLEEAVRLVAPSAEDELEWRGAHGGGGNHAGSGGSESGGSDGDGSDRQRDSGLEADAREWGSDGEWEDGDPAAAAGLVQADQGVPASDEEGRGSEEPSSSEEHDEGGRSGERTEVVQRGRKRPRLGPERRLPPPTLAQTIAAAGLGTAAYELEFEVSLDGPGGHGDGGLGGDGGGGSAAWAAMREARRALLRGRGPRRLDAWRTEAALARAAGLAMELEDTALWQRAHSSSNTSSRRSEEKEAVFRLEAGLATLQLRMQEALRKSGTLSGAPS
jgi:hypothetical protein